MDTRHLKLLSEYLPEKSLDLVVQWLDEYRVALTITRRRNTKMGDYRPPLRKSYHRVSVNGDLHPMAFLVTLVHELAHLVIWERYQRKVKPHGEEWKTQFRQMLSLFTDGDIFPGEAGRIVRDFTRGTLSYRSFNQHFEKEIHKTDAGNTDFLLSELPVNSMFSIHNGRRFVKLEKLRSRYRCREVKSGRLYLISGLAKVQPLRDQG